MLDGPVTWPLALVVLVIVTVAYGIAAYRERREERRRDEDEGG